MINKYFNTFLAIPLAFILAVSCSPKVLPTGEVNYLNSTANGVIELTSRGYSTGTEDDVYFEAEKQAFEMLFFRGIPGSQVQKPLLGYDENKIKNQHNNYFTEFYIKKRYRTFIMSSDKQSFGNKLNYKYVNLRLKINYRALINDLESKGVKRGFGL